MYIDTTLDCGIRLVGRRIPEFRSLSIGIWIRVGAKNEVGPQRGMSHFIEHMFFKGTQRRSARDISVEMDSIGGQLNAFTAKECTCFYARVTDAHLEPAMDILSDMVLNSKLDQQDIDREKNVILEEIHMSDDTPEDLAHELLQELYFGKNPLSQPVLGTRETVSAFEHDGLMSFLNRNYTPSNMVISVAGNFDPEALRALCNRSFGELNPDSDDKAKKRRLPAARVAAKHRAKRIEQAHLCWGFPGISLRDERLYAFNVLNNVFGGGMSSRLFQTIREQRGLAYSVYSYPSVYSDCGVFSVYAGTGSTTAQEVTQLVYQEIEKLRAQGIERAEFDRAKEQLKGNYILGQESTSSQMSSIGRGALLMGFWRTEDEVIERIDSVRFEQVQAIIPDVLNFDAMRLVTVGKLPRPLQAQSLIDSYRQ